MNLQHDGDDRVNQDNHQRRNTRLMTQEKNASASSPAARLWGVLVVTADQCLAIADETDTRSITAVVWPHGWVARRDETGRAVLHNATGSVVAVEGQLMGIGGGFTSNPPDHDCALERTFYANDVDIISADLSVQKTRTFRFRVMFMSHFQ
jgi:hypothetical protein